MITHGVAGNHGYVVQHVIYDIVNVLHNYRVFKTFLFTNIGKAFDATHIRSLVQVFHVILNTIPRNIILNSFKLLSTFLTNDLTKEHHVNHVVINLGPVLQHCAKLGVLFV